jgi:formate hydrogenlyase subunit 6/NADH:ubiquinone oxidoreductase subunit I
MKWPLITETWEGPDRSTHVEYMTKKTTLTIDTAKCTTCKQCVKACPKGALVSPVIPRGVKVPKVERVPILPDAHKCVFCGVCLAVCPFDAVKMAVDGTPIPRAELPIIKEKLIPEFTSLKIGKAELADPNFKNAFWDTIWAKIEFKRKPKVV